MKSRGKNLHRRLATNLMTDDNEKWVRGRSSGLLDARNRHLLCRFVFWGHKNEHTFEWILSQLSKEFYIAESTIGRILESNAAAIQQIRKEKSIRKWREEYDFVKW